MAQVYDHDAERLTFASADEELYEVEISSGHWSHRFLTEAPWFVGGREALALHTGRLRYPPAALRTNTKGRVTVHLLVDTLGRVTERRVARSLSSACDAEALRVARAIPDTFTPGRVGARAVPVRYSVSFLFELP